jgi:hypothetical protein
MLTFEEWVLSGNKLQRFSSGLEPDPEPPLEFRPDANSNKATLATPPLGGLQPEVERISNILCQFHDCIFKLNKLLKTYFFKHGNYGIQLDLTDNVSLK